MFLDIDGNKVFALSFGDAPRTFLAHSGWIGNFEDWIATLAPLSESWRTVVYDHRGAGETVVAPENISTKSLVDDVFRVMDKLSIERCVLAGFSRGTVTALRAVHRHPERFDGLVLMNGYGEITEPNAPVRPRVAPSKWPGQNFEQRLEWFVERCMPEHGTDHIKRWAKNILIRSTPEVADRIFTMDGENAIDWAVEAPKLTLPTLFIHGELDAFYQTQTMRYAQSLFPNSRLVVLEGSGHLPAMTRPVDVAREINAFFNPPNSNSS